MAAVSDGAKAPKFLADNPRTVIDEEQATIRKAAGDARKADLPEKWLALALSGGGIRSASFALGILQAIDAWKLFPRIDYLSTVSGGGYIGASLSYFLHKADNQMARAGQFPFGRRGQYGAREVLRAVEVGAPQGTKAATGAPSGDGPDPVAINSFIRQHAHYLTPSQQLGWPEFIAGAIRAAFTALVVYFPLLLASATALALIEFWIGQSSALADLTRSAWYSRYSCLMNPLIVAEKVRPWCGPVEIGKGVQWFNLPLVVLAVVILISILNAVWFSWRTRTSKRGISYPDIMINNAHWNGRLLIAFVIALVLSVLPWLVHLANYTETLIATAGTSTLLGYLGTLWDFRSRLKGSTSGDSLFAQAKPIIFAALTVLGLLVLAFGIAEKLIAIDGPETSLLWGAGLCVIFFGISAALASIGNLNYVSQHRMYRDRLMEAFCPSDKAVTKLDWAPATDADSFRISDCAPMEGAALPGPYHLINTALVIPGSNKTIYRSRGADNFILSPLYCGSNATGWCGTKQFMQDGMMLPTAMAISGAALNAHSGCGQRSATRDRILSFLLTLFGAQLGYWAPHPRVDGAPQPNFLRPGYRGLFGIGLDEDPGRTFVQLADGGHFENLGLYELVRRRVDVIIASDAGQDKDFVFEDLGIAVERIRVDFGANIVFGNPDHGLMHLLADSAQGDKRWTERYGLATRGYAVARIDYPKFEDPGTGRVDEAKTGYLLFFKATLIDGLPMDLYAYKKLNEDFPDQTTVDQDFDEYQFEAYRELGYQQGSQFFIDMLQAGENKVARMVDLFAWLEDKSKRQTAQPMAE